MSSEHEGTEREADGTRIRRETRQAKPVYRAPGDVPSRGGSGFGTFALLFLLCGLAGATYYFSRPDANDGEAVAATDNGKSDDTKNGDEDLIPVDTSKSDTTAKGTVSEGDTGTDSTTGNGTGTSVDGSTDGGIDATAISALRAEANDVSARVHAIFEEKCYRCHGQQEEVPGLNVLKLDVLISDRGEDEDRYVAPGNLDASYLWSRIDDDSMPADGEPLTAEERAAVREWIETGAAEFPSEEIRPFVRMGEVLKMVRSDLEAMPVEERSHFRYYSFRNLYDDSFASRVGARRRNYTADDLRYAHAALSKLVNSLSRMPDVHVPRSIDERNLVLRVDLRKLGWEERDVWGKFAERYPYGLDLTPSTSMGPDAQAVYEMTGTKLPILRADWFIDTAPRPDLYYDILGLPETADELERQLGVNSSQDFLNDRLKRAGFSESGVSVSNRLLDRHEFDIDLVRRGYYWRSYDFIKSEDKGNLFKYPLGPEFAGNPYNEHAFEADGGEMIFSLPNGMQAYFLTDAKGQRLDAGPIEVVQDSNKWSRTPQVVNALSCMGCHKHGMIDFEDTVRVSESVPFGEVSGKVNKLYAPKEEMDALVKKDAKQFLEAVAVAVGPFLFEGDGGGATGAVRATQFDDPIGRTAREYQRDLEIEEVAAELGFDDPSELAELIADNSALRELGLAPLKDGKAIKRTTWSDPSQSQFHAIARELRIGIPITAE